MAPMLFDRRCRVIVGKPSASFNVLEPDAVEIDGLRVQLKIVKTGSKEPNTAEVSVWNLSADTRARVQAKGSKLVVVAGYRDIQRQVFIGDVRTVDHVRDGAAWVTKFQAGDAERAFRYARIGESFAGGTDAATIVERLVALLGVDGGNAIARVRRDARTFTQGYAAHGTVQGELSRLLDGLGLAWSIQDGRLQVLGPQETIPGGSIEVSETTGLVGSPEHGSPTEAGQPAVLKVRMLLQPEIVPGRTFALVAEGARGGYVAGRVEHAGDTAGGEWYTTAEATPLGA